MAWTHTATYTTQDVVPVFYGMNSPPRVVNIKEGTEFFELDAAQWADDDYAYIRFAPDDLFAIAAFYFPDVDPYVEYAALDGGETQPHREAAVLAMSTLAYWQNPVIAFRGKLQTATHLGDRYAYVYLNDDEGTIATASITWASTEWADYLITGHDTGGDFVWYSPAEDAWPAQRLFDAWMAGELYIWWWEGAGSGEEDDPENYSSLTYVAFRAGILPNLAGAFEAKEREFWRPRPAW